MVLSSKDKLKLLMEGIGTFILASGINFSTIYRKNTDSLTTSQEGQPILLYLAFFAAITITRTISGGHINPAVTLSIYLSKTKEEKAQETVLSLLYMLCQIAGAIISGFFSFIFYRKNIFKLTLAEGITPLNGLLIECIATFIFTYAILCQGNKEANITNDPTISTFIITIALFGCCGIAGNLTGGCLNPAIGIAQNFCRFCITGDTGEMKFLWVYICGPLLGGVISSALYSFFFWKHFNDLANTNNFLNDNNIPCE